VKSKNYLSNIHLFAIALFLLSALIGLLIRWNFTFPIKEFAYKNFLQAHSHVAFLGWGYVASLAILIKVFLFDEGQKLKVYKITIGIIIITLSLMLISFPLVGYKTLSIVLLSLFGIISYVVSYKLLKDIKGKTIAIKMIHFGIYYYLLSSLATWFLAYVIVTQGKTVLYYNTIYFYLHYLYNGYFVFVLFGLLFKIFENQRIEISTKHQKFFFIFLNIACIPAYSLSILWSKVPIVFNLIGFIAAILQLISLVFLIKIIKNVLKKLKWNVISKLLLKFVAVFYSLKISLQIISSIPFIVTKSLALKHYFIIGYLHLFTLGFMSVFLFLLLIQVKKLTIKSLSSKIGILTFLVGIIGTEFLLFLQGFLILIGKGLLKYYNFELFIFSFLLVLGIGLIIPSQFFKKELETIK